MLTIFRNGSMLMCECLMAGPDSRPCAACRVEETRSAKLPDKIFLNQPRPGDVYIADCAATNDNPKEYTIFSVCKDSAGKVTHVAFEGERVILTITQLLVTYRPWREYSK